LAPKARYCGLQYIRSAENVGLLSLVSIEGISVENLSNSLQAFIILWVFKTVLEQRKFGSAIQHLTCILDVPDLNSWCCS